MAPNPTLRKPIHRDKFGSTFSTLRTTTYYDPSSRGPGSHSIHSISWTPTGHLIATGSSDRTLRIWNPDRPQVKNSTELKGHTGSIERVAWNPVKEAELASVSLDGTVRVWDVRSKTCVVTLELGARGLSLVWSDDGRVICAGRGDRAEDEALVLISVVPEMRILATLPQGGQVNQVLFAPTQPLPSSSTAEEEEEQIYTLFLTLGNGTVKICTWTPTSTSLHQLHSFQAHTSAALCISLSPTGRWLATGGSDAMIMLWDTRDWVCRHALSHSAGTVRQVSFSFDGRYLVAAADEDGEEMDVVHVESGEVVACVPLAGNQAGVPRAVNGKAGGRKEDVLEDGVGAKGIGKGLVKVSNVGSVVAASCVAWHPQRYWLAYAGEPGGLRVVGAAGGAM